ncbi:endonuclease/exonuclease/phosphatase family protein [Streptomyces sp. NRRL WC-3742]|uniref:endonuclease/exonuclease/phosphatase family protein n=1 Tax=Streptomyces sp. NRRL WC-3742 TaxID=1463934 RepID=UPI0004C97E0E|nr:endonuclease/exonuclease/phosphatase family protein [Streptomyces sp. NRRL WC-3742]
MDDLTQGFLFGNPDVVGDDVARVELRLAALNIQSPSTNRARDVLDWLYRSQSNVLVLTEVKAGEAADLILKDLESSGFTITRRPAGPDDKYLTVIATKGYRTAALPLAMDSTRFVGARLATHFGDFDVLGLYALTNGMTEESSRNRKAFQEQVLDALRARIAAQPEVPLLITGDFNVLEPDRDPPASRALFADHDYAFYRSLADLGLIDTYRQIHPEGADLTWYGPQGGQRLDHIFISPAAFTRVRAVGFQHDVRTAKISDHSALVAALI